MRFSLKAFENFFFLFVQRVRLSMLMHIDVYQTFLVCKNWYWNVEYVYVNKCMEQRFSWVSGESEDWLLQIRFKFFIFHFCSFEKQRSNKICSGKMHNKSKTTPEYNGDEQKHTINLILCVFFSLFLILICVLASFRNSFSKRK